MSELTHAEIELKESQRKAAKPMLWIGLVSIIMLFAGITSAYIVRQAEGNWLQFDLPFQFYISTFLIVLSSLTFIWANKLAVNNNLESLKTALLLTLILGIGFCLTQLLGWREMVENGIFFTGPKSNAAGSYMYVISGLHLAHVVGGILSVAFVYVKARLNKYSASNKLGIELAATYWHFLDFLWIYLLLFLLFIR